MALPWSSALDVSYVGQYGYNLGQTVDINQVDLGAAYLAQNQDPTLSSTLPGGNAIATDLMRGYRGYGRSTSSGAAAGTSTTRSRHPSTGGSATVCRSA